MTRIDPAQLGFGFTRAVAAAALPVDAAFTPEGQAAIACLPFGDGWQAFVAGGAMPEVFDLPVRMARWARVRITTTPLGVTSCYAIDLKKPIGTPGALPGTGVLGGGGGFHWPTPTTGGSTSGATATPPSGMAPTASGGGPMTLSSPSRSSWRSARASSSMPRCPAGDGEAPPRLPSRAPAPDAHPDARRACGARCLRGPGGGHPLTPVELRVRTARLADAVDEADPTAIRAALHGLNPRQANAVCRAATAAQGGRLRIG